MNNSLRHTSQKPNFKSLLNCTWTQDWS